MTAKEFITKELGDFIKKFPQVRVRYEYHELSNAHFIEVVPNKVYSLNDDYISWETDMWERFVHLYPLDGICFISDDALAGIEKAELTLYGTDYTPVSTKQENVIFDATFNKSGYSIYKGTFTSNKESNHIIEGVQLTYSGYTFLLAA